MSDRTIVFVCLHGAAKSVLAAHCWDRLARERGLSVRATFAGLEPDPEIAPRVSAALAKEGTDLRGERPRRVTADEIIGAWRVVSFGCDLEPLAAGVPVERWDEIPAVSDGFEAAREAIERRVAALIATAARP